MSYKKQVEGVYFSALGDPDEWHVCGTRWTHLFKHPIRFIRDRRKKLTLSRNKKGPIYGESDNGS